MVENLRICNLWTGLQLNLWICNLQFVDQSKEIYILAYLRNLQLQIEPKNLLIKKTGCAATFANLPPVSMIPVANCLKSKISWHCPFVLPFAWTKLYKLSFLLTGKYIYNWIYLKPPPPTHTWRKYILRAELFSFVPNPTRAKNAWSSSTCLLYDVHVQHCTKWKHQILAVIPCQLETISHSHDCESTKRSPPHTHTHSSDASIF